MCSKGRMTRFLPFSTLIAFGFVILPAFNAYTDEVDDILALKAKNHEKVRRYSAEYTVTTHQPKTLKDPKSLKLRYKMKLEKLARDKAKHSHNPWRMETEVLEPLPMHLKVEGEQAWFKDQNGQWQELTLSPEMREQFMGMSERFMGADPKTQKEKFEIKVVRHNNPIFGPRTRTIEFIPKGKAKMFSRMEEDVNDDGLPLETRLYDDHGKQTVKVRVKRHHKEKGVPVVDEMESVATTPAGEVRTETESSQTSVEVEQ